MALQNFNTLMAIVAALGSSTIARLKKTWDGLNNKYTALWQAQQKFVEHSRNYAQYRSAVRTAVAPCLPFLGLYLTDITFCRDGNPQHRLSPLDSSLRLINFDRYQVGMTPPALPWTLSNTPHTENRKDCRGFAKISTTLQSA